MRDGHLQLLAGCKGEGRPLEAVCAVISDDRAVEGELKALVKGPSRCRRAEAESEGIRLVCECVHGVVWCNRIAVLREIEAELTSEIVHHGCLCVRRRTIVAWRRRERQLMRGGPPHAHVPPTTEW